MPPFVVENPRPDDPSSFDGRNWDDRGQAILDAGCEERRRPEPGPTPSRRRRSGSATRRARRRIPTSPTSRRSRTTATSRAATSTTRGPSTRRTTGATSSRRTPTSTRTASSRSSPATTGPRRDRRSTRTAASRPRRRTRSRSVPILECVEELDGGGFLAHLGYDNPNATTIEPPGDQNKFSPGPPNRGQPTAFAAGRVEDAFQVEFDGGALTWSLTGNSETACSGSTRCPAARSRSSRSSSPGATPAAST